MPGEPAVLIVEDDPHYARVLLGTVREKGFKGLVTAHGRLALALTKKYKPVAITLDIFLPDMLGWTVLCHLKQDPETRHIPVQILTVEEERLHGLGHGAFGYMIKPTTTEALSQTFGRLLDFSKSRRKRLLLVEDNEIERQSLGELLSHQDVEISAVDNGTLAAYDASNGKRLWQHYNGQGHDGGIITYTAKGKQYVAVMTGWGSLVSDGYGDLWGEPWKSMPKDSGVVKVFALMDQR